MAWSVFPNAAPNKPQSTWRLITRLSVGLRKTVRLGSHLRPLVPPFIPPRPTNPTNPPRPRSCQFPAPPATTSRQLRRAPWEGCAEVCRSAATSFRSASSAPRWRARASPSPRIVPAVNAAEIKAAFSAAASARPTNAQAPPHSLRHGRRGQRTGWRGAWRQSPRVWGRAPGVQRRTLATWQVRMGGRGGGRAVEWAGGAHLQRRAPHSPGRPADAQHPSPTTWRLPLGNRPSVGRVRGVGRWLSSVRGVQRLTAPPDRPMTVAVEGGA